MGRSRKNFGDHWVTWDDASRTVTISPRYKNASTTDWFGLGNAKIKLNAANLPEKIVKSITGETDGAGLLPTAPFKLRRWYPAPEGLTSVSKTVTGFNGWTETITYPEASGGAVKEATDGDIIQNGYGIEAAPQKKRLGW